MPLERPGARERPGIERTAGDDLGRELERELLRDRVVAANECVALGLPVRERRGGERVEPGGDRGVEQLLRALGERARVVGREHALLREPELARDAQHRRVADRRRRDTPRSAARLPPSPRARRGRRRGRRPRSRRPRAPTSARLRRRPLGVARADRRRRGPLRRAAARARARSRRCPPTTATFTRGPRRAPPPRAAAAPPASRHERARDDRRARRRDRRASSASASSTTSASIKPRVARCDVRGRRTAGEAGEHAVGGPFTARPPISGLTATQGTPRRSSAAGSARRRGSARSRRRGCSAR